MRKNYGLIKNGVNKKIIQTLSEDSDDYDDISKEDESYIKNSNESLQREFIEQKNFLLKFSENFIEKQKKENIENKKLIEENKKLIRENKKFIEENFQNLEKKLLSKLDNSDFFENIQNKFISIENNLKKSIKQFVYKYIKDENKKIIKEIKKIQKIKEKNKKLNNSNFSNKKSSEKIESEKHNTDKKKDEEDIIFKEENIIFNKNDLKNDFNQNNHFLDKSNSKSFITNSEKQFSQSKKKKEQNKNLKYQKKKEIAKSKKRNKIKEKFCPNNNARDLKINFNKKIIKTNSKIYEKNKKLFKVNFNDDEEKKNIEIKKNEGNDLFGSVDYDEHLMPLKNNDLFNNNINFKNIFKKKDEKEKNNNDENRDIQKKTEVFNLNTNSGLKKFNINDLKKKVNFQMEKSSEKNIKEVQQYIENNQKNKYFENELINDQNEEYNNNIINKKSNNNFRIKESKDLDDSLSIISDEEQNIEYYSRSKNNRKIENQKNNKILKNSFNKISQNDVDDQLLLNQLEIYLENEDLLSLTNLLFYPEETLIKKIKADFFKILQEKKENFPLLKLLIEKSKIDLNKKDEEKNSILHLLIKYNQNDLLKFILQSNHNLNEIDPLDNNFQTPLHLSLIENNIIGFFILYYNKASLKLKDLYDNNCLHFAAMYCDCEILKFILDKKLVNYRQVNSDGNMPIFSAAIYQRIDIVRTFLEYQDEEDLFKRNEKFDYSSAYELLLDKYDRRTLFNKGIISRQRFLRYNI